MKLMRRRLDDHVRVRDPQSVTGPSYPCGPYSLFTLDSAN